LEEEEGRAKEGEGKDKEGSFRTRRAGEEGRPE
jgi:hypothetical protein